MQQKNSSDKKPCLSGKQLVANQPPYYCYPASPSPWYSQAPPSCYSQTPPPWYNQSPTPWHNQAPLSWYNQALQQNYPPQWCPPQYYPPPSYTYPPWIEPQQPPASNAATTDAAATQPILDCLGDDLEKLWVDSQQGEGNLLDLIGDYCNITPENQSSLIETIATSSTQMTVASQDQTPTLCTQTEPSFRDQASQTNRSIVVDILNESGTNVLNESQQELLQTITSTMPAQELLELLQAHSCIACYQSLLAYGGLARHLVNEPECLAEYGGVKKLPPDLQEIYELFKRKATAKKSAETKKMNKCKK